MEKEKELINEVAAREETGEAKVTGKAAGSPGKKGQRRKAAQEPGQEPASPEGGQAPVQEPEAQEDGQAPQQEPASPEGSTGATLYSIMTTCDVLNIRSGAGKEHSIVGTIRETDGKKKSHDIVEEKDGWGRLSSGEGWICLSHTRRGSW